MIMVDEIKFEDLTADQKLAHDTVMDVVKGKVDKTNILIKGQAGAGKTLVTKFIMASLRSQGIRGIVLTAPTHAAKKVLRNVVNADVNTIHSVLRIKPDTYEDVRVFDQAGVPKLEECEVLICDEVSMYDDKLFDILMRNVPSRCIIIGLGDEEQIRSVSIDEPKRSPFFKDKRFKVIELKEVKRATGAILDVALKIRNGEWINANHQENHSSDNGENVVSMPDAKSLILKYFENVKTPEDFKENRVLAYTNKLVDSCNMAIRRHIYGKDVEYFIKDEVLVMQEPLTQKININGVVMDDTIFNNSEWVRTLSCEYTSDFISLPGVAGKIMIRYWDLFLRSEEPDNAKATGRIMVITEQEEQDKLQKLLGDAAYAYKNNPTIRPAWKAFWTLKGKFHTVKHLPACTFHKSQGSSIDNAYVFASQIDNADHLDAEQRRELLYVGFSRARKNVYFY